MRKAPTRLWHAVLLVLLLFAVVRRGPHPSPISHLPLLYSP